MHAASQLSGGVGARKIIGTTGTTGPRGTGKRRPHFRRRAVAQAAAAWLVAAQVPAMAQAVYWPLHVNVVPSAVPTTTTPLPAVTNTGTATSAKDAVTVRYSLAPRKLGSSFDVHAGLDINKLGNATELGNTMGVEYAYAVMDGRVVYVRRPRSVPSDPATGCDGILPSTGSATSNDYGAGHPCAPSGIGGALENQVILRHDNGTATFMHPVLGESRRYTVYNHLYSIGSATDGGTTLNAATNLSGSNGTLVSGGSTVLGRMGLSGANNVHLHLTYLVVPTSISESAYNASSGANERFARNPLEFLPHSAPRTENLRANFSGKTVQLDVAQQNNVFMRATVSSGNVYSALAGSGLSAVDQNLVRAGDCRDLGMANASAGGTASSFKCRTVDTHDLLAQGSTQRDTQEQYGLQLDVSKPFYQSPATSSTAYNSAPSVFPNSYVGMEASGVSGDYANTTDDVLKSRMSWTVMDSSINGGVANSSTFANNATRQANITGSGNTTRTYATGFTPDRLQMFDYFNNRLYDAVAADDILDINGVYSQYLPNPTSGHYATLHLLNSSQRMRGITGPTGSFVRITGSSSVLTLQPAAGTTNTYYGSVIGGGDLRIDGAGTQVFDGGTHTYSGGTTVAAGGFTLQGSSLASGVSVGAGGTQASPAAVFRMASGGGGNSSVTGNVTLAAQTGSGLGNGGRLGLDSATHSVTGNFTMGTGSSLLTTVDSAANFGRLNVSGTAQLSGKLIIQAGSGAGSAVTAGMTRTLVQAGTRTGTFSGGVQHDYAYLTPTLSYTATSANVTFASSSGMSAPSYAQVATNSNQAGAGQALTALALAGSSAPQKLDALSVNQAREALTAVSGSAHATAARQMYRMNDSLDELLMSHVHQGGTGGAESVRTSGQLKFYSRLTPAPVTPVSSMQSGVALGLDASSARPALDGWMAVVNGRNRITGDTTLGIAGGDVDARMMQLGMDWHPQQAVGGGDLSLGLSAGHGRENGLLGNDSLDTSSFNLAGYARWSHDSWYAGGYANLAWRKHRVDRRIVFAGVDTLAQSRFNSFTPSLRLETGRSISLSPSWRVEPYAGLRQTVIRQDAYVEQGGGGFSLAVDKRTDKPLELSVGMRTEYRLHDSPRKKTTFDAGLALSRLRGGNPGSLDLSFADAPGTGAFTVQGAPTANTALELNLGMKMQWTQSFSGSVGYYRKWVKGNNAETLMFKLNRSW